MTTIWNAALNDLRIIFRDRIGVLLNLVIVPIALSFAAGAANGAFAPASGTAAPPDVLVDVIDLDGSERSALFLERLRAANERLVLCPADDRTADGDENGRCELGENTTFDEAISTARLESQTSLALIIIPEGFGEAVDSGEAAIVYRANEDATAPSYILTAVQAAAQEIGGAALARQVGLTIADQTTFLTFTDEADRAGFGEAVRDRAAALWQADPIDVQVVRGEVAVEEAAFVGGLSQSFPGMGTMYAMFAVFGVITALIDERRNWTLQRLAMMPVSRAQILGGKLLARFIIGMVQYGIVFGVGLLIGIRYGNDPLALVLVMSMFVLAVTALALMITTFVKTASQASGISLFLALTLAPLGGAWWPLDIVPSWMRTIGHISPVAWAMDGYQELIFFGGGLSDVLPMVGVLALMAAAFFAVGVARFRFT